MKMKSSKVRFLILAMALVFVIPLLGMNVRAEEDQELTVWCWDPAFNLYAMEVASEIYTRDNPDFKLDIVETPWADVQTNINTAAMSMELESLPDIFLMQDNAFQKNMANFPQIFVELTDSGVDFSQFAEAKVNASVVDGKNYGVPFDNGTAVFAVRTDYLEEAGQTVEDYTDITWSEFNELGKVFLEETGHPLISMTAESDLINVMMVSAGAGFFDEDGQPYLAENEVLHEVLTVHADIVSSGVLQMVNDWDQYVGSFTSGNVGGTINGCWILASVQTAEDQAGNWAVTNLPKIEVDGATHYSNNGGSSWAVSTNSKNPELAFDFLAKTFGGSVELYETILPTSGAMATWLPMADSEIYAEPQEFFAGQAIYQDLTNFADEVPSVPIGVYHYEAVDFISAALQNILNGSDIVMELESAEEQVKHLMQ